MDEQAQKIADILRKIYFYNEQILEQANNGITADAETFLDRAEWAEKLNNEIFRTK